jgi:MFS-type transporter involved in bile tolerance (Atg22 family)
MRGVRQIVATVVAVMICAGGATVFACPVCFGAEETTLISGTKLGILVMIAVTLAVQGAFLAFFLYLRKHAKDNAEAELDGEWSELQRSRT